MTLPGPRPEGDPGSSNISEPFLLVADRDGEIILQVNITSGSNTTLPLGDVGQPRALDHDPLTDYVYWSDDRNQKIHRARRDGSGRETILDITRPHTERRRGQKARRDKTSRAEINVTRGEEKEGERNVLKNVS
ncbi:hypothetical protein Bbelb_242180 [Branchiostoma belcheri]|nr:hypothetical protein Bbelb_242180 [Branchiostoma belcheri]